MKFTDIVRDHYRGPAYGQEFTTWYTKVRHGFSTAQVPESAQVDHLVAVLDSPAQELAFSFIKKYNAEHPTEGLGRQQLVQHHEDKLAALVAHLQSKSSVVGTRPELRLLNKWKTMKQYDGEPAAMFYHRINVLHDQLANQPDPEVPGPRDVWSTFVNGLQHDVQLHVRTFVPKPGDMEEALQAAEVFEETKKIKGWGSETRAPATRPARKAQIFEDTNLSSAREEAGYKLGGRYTDAYLEDKRWGKTQRFRAPRRGGTLAGANIESQRETRLRAGAGQGRGQMRSRSPQPITSVMGADRPARTRPDGHYGPPSGSKPKPEPGSRPEICFPFLRDAYCRFGDDCHRIHVPTLETRADVRRHVKTTITDDMRRAARE